MKYLVGEFVSFEIANNLRKLGFDETCMAYFYQKHFNFCSMKSDQVASPFQNSNFYGEDFAIIDVTYIGCPTWRQAFKWFRDIQFLKGDVKHSDAVGTTMFTIWKWNFDNNIGKWERIGNIASYETYEEAELKCMEKLIELKTINNGKQ